MTSDVQSFSSRAKEITCGYFMQDGAITHTDNYSIDVLREVFEDRMISCRL
jgi:hypothetical protein